MSNEKNFSKQSKIVFVILGIVVLLGLVGAGYYYWWTGTPEYSISQIGKAVETHNSELGLKYIDVDAIFENFWIDMKSNLLSESSGTEGLEGLGTMFGLQLAESMKPTIKEQFRQGIESWFTEDSEIGSLEQENLEIKKEGDSAYLELPDNVKIIFTKKSGERYWVISKIEGFTAMAPDMENTEKETNNTK